MAIKRKKQKDRLDLMLFAVLIVLFAILVNMPDGASVEKTVKIPSEGYTAVMALPAVDDNGNGISTTLTVNVKPGTGRVLTDIDKLLFWTDTQQSMQVAKQVAANYTGIDTSNIDISYSIEAEAAALVGGPSAGAGLAIATIAALENRELRHDVVITGTVNPDESIGQVGAIVEKAIAAKESGATLFLVPIGESTQNYVKPHEKCVSEPGYTYCQTEYKKVTVNIAKDIDIEVKEVGTISEAVEYFIR